MAITAWAGWLVSLIAQLLEALIRLPIDARRDREAARKAFKKRVQAALRQDVV
jgi:hypothetical protein